MTSPPPKARMLAPRPAARTTPPTLTEIAERELVVDTATGVALEPALAMPATDANPAAIADVHARALVERTLADLADARRELAAAHHRAAELARYNRRLVGERDAAIMGDCKAPWLMQHAVVCNGGCDRSITFRPPPTDEAILWLTIQAARWVIVGDEHYCPTCAHARKLGVSAP